MECHCTKNRRGYPPCPFHLAREHDVARESFRRGIWHERAEVNSLVRSFLRQALMDREPLMVKLLHQMALRVNSHRPVQQVPGQRGLEISNGNSLLG